MHNQKEREKSMSLESNKKTVVEYYELAFIGGQPEKAASLYQGDEYIQHNPDAENGSKAFIEFVNYLRSKHPQLQLKIKRVIAENDLVVTHSHLILSPGDIGKALVDIFRLKDGKIVEHWDVMQEVPNRSANKNSMF